MRTNRRIFLGLALLIITSCSIFLHKGNSGLAFRRIFAEPGRIGMVAPSSRALYKRMAKEVLQSDISKEALIVELGPGTGVGTQVLLDRGIPADRLLCVELDPELREYMTEKFPEVRTVLGNAADLETILGDKCGQVTAIISGVPLKLLSKEQATAIIKACHAVLKPQGKMTQFTYGISPTPTVPGLERNFGGFVLFNLPPAFVWTLTKTK